MIRKPQAFPAIHAGNSRVRGAPSKYPIMPPLPQHLRHTYISHQFHHSWQDTSSNGPEDKALWPGNISRIFSQEFRPEWPDQIPPVAKNEQVCLGKVRSGQSNESETPLPGQAVQSASQYHSTHHRHTHLFLTHRQLSPGECPLAKNLGDLKDLARK